VPLFADEKRVCLFDREERVPLFSKVPRVELSLASLRQRVHATVHTITDRIMHTIRTMTDPNADGEADLTFLRGPRARHSRRVKRRRRKTPFLARRK